MKNSFYILFAILILSGISGCKKTSDEPKPTLNLEQRVFLLEMIDIMRNNSVNRFSIDWNKFKEDVLLKAGATQDQNGIEPAIKLALTLLGDNHSSFITQGGKYVSGASEIYSANQDVIGIIPNDIGYIKVGAFNGINQEAQNFAINIQKTIKDADKENLKGVDLRGNSGCNMWPMVAGLGPILGEGLLGYFVDPLNIESAWTYKNGVVFLDTYTYTSVPEPYNLKKPSPKVAVLINASVASSGEATAIAFKGRANTKFFGTPTFGVSTSNKNFELKSGNAHIDHRNYGG